MFPSLACHWLFMLYFKSFPIYANYVFDIRFVVQGENGNVQFDNMHLIFSSSFKHLKKKQIGYNKAHCFNVHIYNTFKKNHLRTL